MCLVNKSFEEYQKLSRSEWVISRCGMAVLAVNMTYWTFLTEKAL